MNGLNTRMNSGSNNDDFAAEMARLENALERIAVLSKPAEPHPAPMTASVDTGVITERLDSMITRLRSAIGEA